MFEPCLALQTAVRSALIASPAVVTLVPAASIRAGSTRPDLFPMIILAGGSTAFLGRAAGSQLVARASIDLHIWAIEDGADTARQIGGAVLAALIDAPAGAEFAFDDWQIGASIWMRDPQPELSLAHGVLTIESVIRWSV